MVPLDAACEMLQSRRLVADLFLTSRQNGILMIERLPRRGEARRLEAFVGGRPPSAQTSLSCRRAVLERVHVRWVGTFARDREPSPEMSDFRRALSLNAGLES